MAEITLVSMELQEMIEYLQWADSLVFDCIDELDDTLVQTIFYKNGGTIHERLLHLAEEYLAWYFDILGKRYPDEIKRFAESTSSELMQAIRQYHGKWLGYIKSPPKTKFEIDEGEGLIVNISLDEVVYNLVNHATYHRGQINTLLRMAGHEVPMVDYYWYKIHKLRS